MFRYVTEGSFDAYMWQTLETKSKFIHQVMTGNTHVRHIEDIDSRALTYAEVKAIASGNPMVIEKASVDAEVMRLQRLRHQHAHTQDRIRWEHRSLAERIPNGQKFIENLQLDMKQRTDTRAEAFQITLEKSMVKDRAIAGELLLRIAKRVGSGQHYSEVGTFAGFPLCVRSSGWRQPEFILKARNQYALDAGSTPLGMVRSLEYLVQNMESQLVEKQTEVATMEKQRDELKTKIGQPFEYEEKLGSLIARQNELGQKLDLSKNQAANSLAGEAVEQAVEASVQDEIQQGEDIAKSESPKRSKRTAKSCDQNSSVRVAV
jgi:hypothetical protein